MQIAMAEHHTTTSVAISIACLVVVALLSFPSANQFLARLRAKKNQYHDLSELYTDEDGVATEESQAAYSDLIPRLLLIIISVVASLDALATAVLTTTRPNHSLIVEQWLQLATWVSLL